MPLTKSWEIDFNAGDTAAKRAKVSKFYANVDGKAGATPQNLRLGSDGSGSFMTSTFGAPEAGAVVYDTYAEMQAAAPANGTVGYCYDLIEHGRYVRAAGVWGPRSGDVRDAGWNDPNHYIRGHLNLPAQTWSQAAHPAAPAGRQGFPDVRDLRGGELRYRMRLRDFYKPEGARIVQHIQTHVPALDAWGDPNRQYWVNMIQIADPMDDQLNLGKGGFFDRSPVRGVRNSQWQDVVVRLSPDDRFWMQLGGAPGRQGMPDDDVRYFNYGVAPADTVLGDWTGNAMVVIFYPSVDPMTRQDAIPIPDRVRGHIDIQKIELWRP